MIKLLLNNLLVISLCCAFTSCTKKANTSTGIMLPNITGVWKGEGWYNGVKFDMNLDLRKEKDSVIYTSGTNIYRGTWKIEEFTFIASYPTTYGSDKDTLIIWAPISSQRLFGNWYYKLHSSVGGIYDLKRPM